MQRDLEPVAEQGQFPWPLPWIAIAGPSGAGKDTLLNAVREALDGDPRFHFARRSITRPATSGGEVHEPLMRAPFAKALAGGGFILHWQAHGLDYGIRQSEAPTDRVVIVSLSRSVLREAAALRPLRVIEVTAPPALLAERLARRGREDAAQIAARLAREMPLPEGFDVTRVMNDGSVKQGAERLREALEAAATACVAGRFRP